MMASYNDPQPPKDSWAKRLYDQNGLNEKSSMADIEPKATELLSRPDTALAGAELVLGRRIDGREQDIAMLYGLPGASAEDRFALLLLQKSTEEPPDTGQQRQPKKRRPR
jgi:hypothetical protein